MLLASGQGSSSRFRAPLACEVSRGTCSCPPNIHVHSNCGSAIHCSALLSTATSPARMCEAQCNVKVAHTVRIHQVPQKGVLMR